MLTDLNGLSHSRQTVPWGKYYHSITWQLSKQRSREIKWLAEDHLVSVLHSSLAWCQAPNCSACVSHQVRGRETHPVDQKAGSGGGLPGSHFSPAIYKLCFLGKVPSPLCASSTPPTKWRWQPSIKCVPSMLGGALQRLITATRVNGLMECSCSIK